MHLELYQYLLLANALDILTGLSKALATGTLSSKKLKNGAMSKAAIWLVVSVSFIVQDYLGVDISNFVIGYYLIMELVSVLENVSEYTPIPDKLKALLSETNTKNSEKEVSDDIIKMIEEKENKDVNN